MINNLIILAGGASSRMKKESTLKGLSEKAVRQANTRNKGLIEIGEKNTPFLHYLLHNAKTAGYLNIYIVIAEKDDLFQAVYGKNEVNNSYKGLTISFVRQHIVNGRSKPQGTADALYQALEQYPILTKSSFVVCNCDNLYSTKVFTALKKVNSRNALIGYDREGLNFSSERIGKFALMKIDEDGYLMDIIEKPSPEEALSYQDEFGKLRVSMNIFKFDGSLFYPFLKNCPIHPERDEKELPTALLKMIREKDYNVKVIPISEHVIDLTSKDDISIVEKYLKKNYPVGLKWE
ncbi:sugar phosphate nucleotidyltransferase [Croceitalea vernalis]|uniref:Sugar phosphate nucleotidyltransferase n=1 Tax=Croceitalea vernalis TaxID=3075599 RepID=A0ABU3BCZ3_9FLAO|nr:sugar phosphate nucleotidyltransferase [Croceitalea sp. P007]MDT0620349.1 sugar phosphate nucleotidyltransferase [Croceitalea sp. P007]